MIEYTVIDSGNDLEWFLNGERHREDGPAVERKDGSLKEYWIHGKRHRTDGPAYEYISAVPYSIKQYWVEGKQLSENEFGSLEEINGIVYIPISALRNTGL